MTESEMYLARYATESGLPIWTAAGQVIDNLYARLLTERNKTIEECAFRMVDLGRYEVATILRNMKEEK